MAAHQYESVPQDSTRGDPNKVGAPKLVLGDAPKKVIAGTASRITGMQRSYNPQ